MNSSCLSNYSCRFIFLLFSLLLLSLPATAQEINADVSVDRSQINSTSLNFVDNLSDEIESYINEHDWINAEFQPAEQINVNIQITLLSVDDNFNFNAQVVFRSRRPIYNSTRETVLFFYNDENWSFNYTPNRALIHDELQFDALTSFFDFYAYVLLGYDFDSFEQLGGNPYFSEAQNIVSQAQSSGADGWNRDSNTRRNRAELVSELLNTNYSGFRSALYHYHRKGLDLFINDPEKARRNVIAALEQIQSTKASTSSNLLFNTFFNSKYREIVFIFEDAQPSIQNKAFELLSDIDPSHLSEYRKLQ